MSNDQQEPPLIPSQEAESDTPFDPAPILGRLDTLEREQGLLRETIKFVKDTNSVILLVLALGFVALLASFISSIIQATNSNTATQIEFIKSVEKFTDKVDQLNNPTRIINSSQSANPK